MTRENAPCKNRCLIKAGLAIGFVMAGGLGRAETTRELRDGKYWIDVPQGETYTLAESDVDVLVPDEGAQPELWKIGPGTLEMTTNGLANCAKMMSYNADIYATNGLLRTLSEYALGNYTKNTTTEKSQTFIWPGAAYDNGYQRDEQATGGATVGITQREMIHIAGNGFGDYSALNETEGNHIMIGKVTLDGDARVGKSPKNTQIRYHELNFNGYTITSGGNLGFGSLPVANVPAVPLVISSGHLLTFTGAGITGMAPGPVIRFENDAQLSMDGMNTAEFYWGLNFVSNGTIRAQTSPSKQSVATNTWNGPISVGPGGKLKIAFNASSRPMTLNREVVGGCEMELTNDGTLTLGNARHRIRRLIMNGANRKLRLPEGFVLEVQSFYANGAEKPEGDYTSANLANIVSGTVRVNPDFPVHPLSQAGEDYTVTGFGSATPPQVTTGASGNCSIFAEGTVYAEMTFTGLDAILSKARFRVDASAATSITYVAESTWTSTNGLRGVSQWKNVNSPGVELRFNNFTLTGEWSASKNAYHRYVSAYPTVQDYTVNGVTRPYIDLGEFYGDMDTSERYYDNAFSPSPTTAAMTSKTYWNGELVGLEYHVVFGDAHPNPTNANRMAIFGRNNCFTYNDPDYMPGRRGAGGKLFAQTDKTTEAFRDGRIWADNVATNSTYTPEWDDVHVYTVIPTNAFMGATHADYDRLLTIGVDSYARYGGARYGELLVYSGATNTAAERFRIDAYLMRKWVGRGLGAEMAFETVTLTNGATLSMSCPAYADVGSCYRIGTLKGDGTLSVDAKDALVVENLAFAFTDRESCESISTAAPLTLADNGTITITMPVEPCPKEGVYTLFTAPNAANIEALDAWTVVCPEKGIRVKRAGNVLTAEVSSGFMVIMR